MIYFIFFVLILFKQRVQVVNFKLMAFQTQNFLAIDIFLYIYKEYIKYNKFTQKTI